MRPVNHPTYAFLLPSLLLFLFLLLPTLPQAESADVYQEKAFMPAAWCTSVDISPDRSTVYTRAHFGDWNEGVRLFSNSTYQHIKDFENLPNVPWTILASTDGNHVYASHYYGGAVVKLDASTGAVVKSIAVGPWPGYMAFDSVRRYLCVGVNLPGTGAVGSISVVDTATDTVVGDVALNGEPNHCLVVSPDDTFLYVGTHNCSPERLFKIKVSDRSVVGTLDMPGLHNPAMSASPDGNFLYLADDPGGFVRIIETASLTEAGTYTIPHVQNFSVAPSGGYALATSHTSGSLDIFFHVFDMTSKSIVQTISKTLAGSAQNIHAGNSSILWDSERGKAYVPVLAEGGGVMVLSPAEEPWQVLYQTDFSTDPGWTTNAPQNFYWNEAAGNYYFKRRNGSEEYSYRAIAYDPGLAYRLEFDACLTRCDWAADLFLSLSDPDMHIASATTWQVSYHRVDQGRTASLIYYDAQGGTYHPGGAQPAPFQLNAWYRNVAVYDPGAGTLSLRVTKVSDGSLVGEMELTGVGSFPGVDRLSISAVGHAYASGAIAEGYVDNIVLARATGEPQAPSVTQFAVNGGQASAEDRLVSLNNVTINSPTHYMASEDSDFSGATWQPYSAAPQFTLSEGEGEKTVYFKTKNDVGESNVVSDSIVFKEWIWQEIYSTDFSSDPQWTTNSPEDFYWNEADGNYCFKRWNTGEQYSYKSIPFDPGASYRLEFDVYITRCDWAASLYLGLGDPDMDIGSATAWHVSYHKVDQGKTASLIYLDSEGGSYHPGGLQPAPFQLNTWYHNAATYDAAAGTLSLRVTKVSDGSLVGGVELTGVGSFAGVDRLYMSSVGHHYAPGATAEGYIDNLRLTRHAAYARATAQVLSLSKDVLRIAWDSMPGLEYQLWAASSLPSDEWVSMGPKMGGTGDQLYIDDYVIAVRHRFYRVEKIQP